MGHRDEQCKTCGYGLTPLWMADGFRIVDDVRLAGRPTATHAEYLTEKLRILRVRGHQASDAYRAHHVEIVGSWTYGPMPIPVFDLRGAAVVMSCFTRPGTKVLP